MREALDDLWGKLENSPRDPAGGWKRLRVPGLGSTPVYLAVSLETGLEGLILEIPTAAMPAVSSLPASAGFEMLSEPVIVGRTGRTRLILGLTSDGFRDVFRALAVDMATVLSETSGSKTIAASFVSRVRRWQRFLEVHGAKGLSDSARRGLFSELLILQQLLYQQSEPAKVIQGWRGPVREPHDFVLPGGDIEVKSTGRQSTDRIEVANLDQLDELGATELWVVHIVLAETEGSGQTLPELVAAVREASGEAVDLYKERLHLAGYIAHHEDRYHLPRYQLLASDAFLVSKNFPRLTSGSVQDGVVSARYSISLSAIEPFRVANFDPRSLLST